MIYANGNVNLNGIIINPLIKKDIFLEKTSELNPEKIYIFGNRIRYSIDNILFLNVNYIVSAVFQDEFLIYIELLPFDKEIENKINVFTNENQMRNKLINDDLLKSLFGSSKKLYFPWGSIESIADTRSGMSYISISYKHDNH
ncbi:hypothetical protein V2H77_02255 [Photorhabdus sp. P32]|uniref:hypothetical protein n=1 Tax=Photorhabdus sp. P32 TaxID=3117549 RepID=UPI00311B3920